MSPLTRDIHGTETNIVVVTVNIKPIMFNIGVVDIDALRRSELFLYCDKYTASTCFP